jgi:organic radical activating enzyme
MRRPTVEWQVCGICNYDCSYCIQSKASRVGHPSEDEVSSFLAFFRSLGGTWEIKMTGGEPFAFKAFLGRIIPGLVEATHHRISVLTNLSAPPHLLERFAELTRGRLHIVSASLHLEHTSAEEFVERALLLRERMDPEASLVCNTVLVPGRLEAIAQAKALLESRGLKVFPQVMKTKRGVVEYGPEERRRLVVLTGERPSPREANLAPSYRGALCWTGVDYFVLTQTGDAWSCRTARRFDEGYLGNVHRGDFARRLEPVVCGYDICPCTVPANRGMIEGLADDVQREARAVGTRGGS